MKHTLRLTYNQSTRILFNVVLVYIICIFYVNVEIQLSYKVASNIITLAFNTTEITAIKYLCLMKTVFSFMIYHQVCKKSNSAGATSGTKYGNPSGAPEFTRFLIRFRFLDLLFSVVFCRLLFVTFSLFLLTIVMSAILLIAPSVSPSLSYVFINI